LSVGCHSRPYRQGFELPEGGEEWITKQIREQFEFTGKSSYFIVGPVALRTP
jgi:hypothetical protein